MASLNTGDFSSTPSPRILQLARHRESKAVWLTTPRKLTWGNQEPIWPLSWAALKAVPTQRIQVLSRPKRDFSALRRDLLRNDRRGEEATKSARLVSSAAQYEHMNRLATPRSRPWSSREVRCPKERGKLWQVLA
ncbi:uncharacterized protein LOC134300424 isoform X2 [Trichomycterus rosablanca]|uniref:uncharacterized protein LOC134300424 isoform X2 n=1 Tax=Trichomycterus rosablanca TaxID=2290929 RepID=UPI002F3547B3